MKRFILITLLLLAFISAMASENFDSLQQEQQYHRLLQEFRCLVCQNQSLSDSEAPLAQDLREKIYLDLRSGSTSNEIKTHLKALYGDFVLYDPPWQKNTWLLWAGPILLLLIGILIIFKITR